MRGGLLVTKAELHPAPVRGFTVISGIELEEPVVLSLYASLV
jgi:hypothetical protein